MREIKKQKAKERLEEIERRIAPFTRKKFKKRISSEKWDLQKNIELGDKLYEIRDKGDLSSNLMINIERMKEKMRKNKKIVIDVREFQDELLKASSFVRIDNGEEIIFAITIDRIIECLIETDFWSHSTSIEALNKESDFKTYNMFNDSEREIFEAIHEFIDKFVIYD